MMESIDDKVILNISKRGRGTVLFASEFTRYGNAKSVSKALERLTAEGKIIRVARGIYCYPKIDKVMGLGVLYPSFEEIAQAIAKRDKARIIPSSQYALNKLGFTTQVPMNVVYYTDGSQRKIKIFGNRGILFKHTASPKIFAFRNKMAMLLTFALKEIGQDRMTEEQKNHVRELLSKENKEDIMQDFPLIPLWIRDIISKSYEQ
jgi:hypothetical protein